MRVIDMSGRVVGLWEVVTRAPHYSGRAHWECICLGCKTRHIVKGSTLRENIKGGCKRCRFGVSLAKLYRAEHKIWVGMKTRVFNRNRKEYKRYSALGIHADWVTSFESFLSHIGPRPSEHYSVDRIDNDVGYFPGNVRWATRHEQGMNTRRNIFIYGKPLMDYAKTVNVPYNTIKDRYYRGEFPGPYLNGRR